MPYTFPSGPTTMWFILHTGTPGCEHVMSIDFDRALAMLPEQDDVLEPEFEALDLPLHTDVGPAAPPIRYATVDDVTPASSERALCTPPATAHPPTRCATPEARPVQRHTILSDGVILKAVSVYGPSWSRIARMLGGREFGWYDAVVRNRYMRICAELGIDPPVGTKSLGGASPQSQHTRWSAEEDRLLREQLAMYPQAVPKSAWVRIGEMTATKRTKQAVRNRAIRLGLIGRAHRSELDKDKEVSCKG